MRVRSQSPHLPEDAGLVTHGPPSVREADREVECGHDGNGSRIGGDEMQVANGGSTVRLGDVAMLIVYTDPESEAVPKQEQMPSGATATIDDPHPFPDDVLKEIEFGTQEGLNLGRLRGRIQSPIQ